jgi:hypothetical protein
MSTIRENFFRVFKNIDEDTTAIFDQHMVSDQLKEAITADTLLEPEELAEVMAFALVDQFQGSEMGFGNYFGAQAVWIGEDGKEHHYPSLSQITPAMLDYWKKRISEVKHPFLTARYSGLAWDLSQVINGQAGSHDLRKKFIEASLELIQKRLFKDSLTGSFLLGRLIDIASKFNDKEFFSALKTLVLDLQSQYDSEGKVRNSVFAFDVFTKYKKLEASEEEVMERVKKMEEFLTILSTHNEERKTDPWGAEAIASRLSDFYLKKNDKHNIKRSVLMVGQAYEPLFVNASNFQVAGWLQAIYKFYKHYGLNDEAEKIALRMREMGVKSAEEMGTVAHKFEIPKDKMDELVESIYHGSKDEIFAKIINQIIPDKEFLKKSLIDFAKETPLQFMYGTQLQDRKGRPVANVGSLADDIEGQLVLRIIEKMKFDDFFLHFILQGGIDKTFLNLQSILQFLSKSAIIEKSRLLIIERALVAYFADDYLVFIHLIIPQIEEAIRNLVDRNGGNAQKFKNGVFNLRTFDDIIRDPIVEGVLGNDLQTYFRIIFTDARGLNLRNEVCHGMVEPELFDKETANRILHALFCLGMIRIEENK